MANEFKVKNGLLVSGSANINASGSEVFSVDGTSGRLFQIDDSLSGSLFSVNTAAGLPVIEAFSDNTARIGQFGQKALFVSQSKVGVGKEDALNGTLDVSGSLTVTGSLLAPTITGSLLGTTSFAVTASWAITPAGTAGTAGSSGTSGANGANGTSGSSGTAGSIGSSGTRGSSGSSGTSGANGANDTSGSSGTSGANGANGTSGSSVTSGANGANGTSGSSGTSGANGANGTSGSSGSSGTRGSSGTSGANGANGTSGSSGTSGANGANGTSGSSGSSGTRGSSGSSGTSGANGANGTSGSSGTSGANGANGTSGSSGTSGANGANGTSDSSGSSGTRGSSGTSGANDANGTSGSSGTSGANGANGTSGSSGSSGTRGSSGSSGTSGANGANGTSGSSGTSGANGANGTSGSSGSSGTRGSSGTSGANGANGTSGSSGTSGANGANGTSGSSGTSGANGANGTSGSSGSSGTRGSSGTSGVNGANGSSGTSGVNGANGTSGSSGTSGTGFSSITNPVDNRILTSLGTVNTANAEANLTFNGTSLILTGSLLTTGSNVTFTGASTEFISAQDQILTLNSSDSSWNYIGYEWNGVRKFYVGIDNGGRYVLGSDSGDNFYFNGANVGINTTSPISGKLQVVIGGDSTGITLERTAGGFFTGHGFASSNPYFTYYANTQYVIGYGTSTGLAPSLNTLILKNTGQIQLPQYTTTTSFTGTAAGVLAFDSSGNVLTIATPGGSPGGSDSQIQYNNGGSFGGASAFLYDDTTNAVKIQASGSTLFTISGSRGELFKVSDSGSTTTLAAFTSASVNILEVKNTGITVNGSLTASLQSGYAWIGGPSGTTIAVSTSSFGGGGGGTLSGLSDVIIASPQNGQVLAYSGSVWTNETRQLRAAFTADVANTWSNMPTSASFFDSSTAFIQEIDLSGFYECRLLVNKLGTSGAANSKLILRYNTTYSQTATNYSDIGTSEVSVATNVTNTYLDSGWIALEAAARANIFVTVVGSGGDGAADPQFGHIIAVFR